MNKDGQVVLAGRRRLSGMLPACNFLFKDSERLLSKAVLVGVQGAHLTVANGIKRLPRLKTCLSSITSRPRRILPFPSSLLGQQAGRIPEMGENQLVVKVCK